MTYRHPNYNKVVQHTVLKVNNQQPYIAQRNVARPLVARQNYGNTNFPRKMLTRSQSLPNVRCKWKDNSNSKNRYIAHANCNFTTGCVKKENQCPNSLKGSPIEKEFEQINQMSNEKSRIAKENFGSIYFNVRCQNRPRNEKKLFIECSVNKNVFFIKGKN